MSRPTVVRALVGDKVAPALDLALAARGFALERTALDDGSDQTWVVDAALASDDDLEALIERSADVIVVASAARAGTLSSSHGTRIVLLIDATPAPLIADHIALAIERRRLEVDGLTRVLSRRAFWQRLELQVAADEPHAVINLDIDHFKRINDEHGHLVGDTILRAVANRLDRVRQSVPESILARSGGEEFSIYAPLTEDQALVLADAALEAVRTSPCVEVAVTLSAGVATAVGPSDPELLLQAADEALYAAKADGRDRAVSYSDLAKKAAARDRDVALDAFETRTRVIAERVAEAITARGRKLFDRLKEQADIDPVTALFTRGYLDRRLRFELQRAAGDGTTLTVALIDIDHFGEVNKAYGWPTGDQALRDVADAVSRTVRKKDWVARYGGEELCVVMVGTDLEEAEIVLQRIRKAVAITRLTSTDGRDFQLTVSIGAAIADGSGEPVIERASARLLDAKRSGRNCLAL